MCEILHIEGADLSTCVTGKTQCFVHNEHIKNVELLWGCGCVLDELTVLETSSDVDLHYAFDEKLRLISSSLAEDLGCACPKKRCNMLAMKPSCSIASRSADEVSSNVRSWSVMFTFLLCRQLSVPRTSVGGCSE